MNIAIVTSEFVSENSFDGGLANYTYKLTKWLLSKKHNVTIFLISDTTTSFSYEGIRIEKIKFIDYAWHIKYYFNRFKLGFLFPEQLQCYIMFRQSSYVIYKALKVYNKKNKIDIIHYPHLCGFAFYRPRNIPFVVRLSSSTKLCNEIDRKSTRL